MLLLNRKVGEEVVVGDEDLVVRVIALSKDIVRLGFLQGDGPLMVYKICPGEEYYDKKEKKHVH